MDLLKIFERKKAKTHTINEGMFNINYIMNKAKDSLAYYDTLRVLEENQGRIPYTELTKLTIKTIQQDLQECEIVRLKTRLAENVKYYKNMKNIKTITERMVEKYDCELDCVIREADTMVSADRILNNQAQLERRFNMNKFIENYNIFSENSTISLIEELCFMIDGCFKCSNDLKFNVAMENISYALFEKGSIATEEEILETISRYFEITGADVENIISESTVIAEKTKITVLNRLKDKSVSKVKQVIKNIKEIKTPQQVKSVIRVLYSQSPQQVLDDVPNFLTWIRTFIAFSTVAINPYLACIIMLVDQYIALTVKQNEADKMVKKFQQEKEKSEKKLDKLKSDKARENLEKYIETLDKSIDKLEDYRDSLHGEKEDDSMYEITQEMKDASDVLNEGRFGYTPFTMTKQCFREKYYSEVSEQFGIIKECLNTFSKPSVVKEHVSELTNDFINHPLNYLSENGNIYIPLIALSENIQDYSKKNLMNSISRKINKNYKLVEESAENGTTLNLYSEYAINLSNKPLHASVLEAYDRITNIEKSLKEYTESSNYVNENICDYIENAGLDDVITVTEMSSFAEPFIKNRMKSYLIESSDKWSSLEPNNIRLSYLNDSLKKFNEYHEINENNISELAESYNDLKEIFDIQYSGKSITESSALWNSLLMAKEKLKKSAMKLSDKDKEVSNRIDNYMSNIIEKTQRSLTNKNREAVIKGSILPSASAALKLGLASIATFPINPLISIIVLIGGLGAAKIGTMKEKQYIMDEIEIELKLVDKKIQLAERNDDTKSLEKLYRIEKQLQREKTRILYNKKNYRPIERER